MKKIFIKKTFIIFCSKCTVSLLWFFSFKSHKRNKENRVFQQRMIEDANKMNKYEYICFSEEANTENVIFKNKLNSDTPQLIKFNAGWRCSFCSTNAIDILYASRIVFPFILKYLKCIIYSLRLKRNKTQNFYQIFMIYISLFIYFNRLYILYII